MTTHRKIALALPTGIGAALLAAAALLSGSASAGQTVSCSASGLGFRQLATVSVSDRDPSICIRVKLGTPATPGTPDCWQAVTDNGLTCIDGAGKPNIIDL